MKVCSKCKKTKPLDQFSKKAANKTDGLQSHCKDCNKERLKRHYNANVDYYVAKAKSNLISKIEWLNTFKDKPCTDCNRSYPPYVLDFDHIDPSQKLFSVGEGIKRYSKSKILDEIAKCDLVCANCHRERTQQRFTP